MTKIAFVGLGNMGWPMAAHLVRAGYQVTGVDVDRIRAESWAATHDAPDTPAGFATSVAAVSEVVDVIVTMLPSGAEVREVLLSAAADAKEGMVAVDMSSADPVGTRELGAELASAGIRLVDAPVSGGVPRAVEGTLSIMIGGEPDAIEIARPVLAAMGERLFEVGALGNGHAMKCLNNYVAGTAFVACSEALAIGQRFGLDPTTMFDVMNVSTARCFNTDLVMKQHVVSGEFASGFALGLLAKDVGIADALAAAMGADTPLADLVAARLAEARDALGFGVDHTRAHQHWSA
ncbi:MAG TPA: NAD(P)-dependent oxidoreductase [Ilumatobacter sp.]|nr:NAD(P)-dependent oxidoreductase [Ilumatobacter sp.]